MKLERGNSSSILLLQYKKENLLSAVEIFWLYFVSCEWMNESIINQSIINQSSINHQSIKISDDDRIKRDTIVASEEGIIAGLLF